MKERLALSMQHCGSLDVADAVIITALKTRREAGHPRLGFVAGIISSDGPEHIDENFAGLDAFTSRIKSVVDYPLLSAPWAFTVEQFARLEAKSRGPDFWEPFWGRILRSMHVTHMFFTPRWTASRGARYEHQVAQELGLVVHYVEERDNGSLFWNFNPRN